MLTYISMVGIIGFVFNYSLREHIFPSDIYIALFLSALLALLVLANIKELAQRLRSFKRSDVIFSALLGCCALWTVIRNGDLAHGNFGKPFFTLYAVVLLFVLVCIKSSLRPALGVTLAFSAEHVLFTWICFIFPEFYKNNIMGLFPVFSRELTYQFEHGQIAGLTMHYSTNAIYLSIGLILLAAVLLASKKYRYYCIAPLLLTFGALLLTGKRGTMVFTVAALFVMYIVFGLKDIKKTLIRVGIIAACGAAAIAVVSIFIPTITQSFTRFFGQADITNGRMPMYTLAINEFIDAPIFGIGWGQYKYQFDLHGVYGTQSTMDAHNVYLQLLCETGIVGLIFFVGLFGYLLYRTVRLIAVKKVQSVPLAFSLGLQLFFLMYCLTGNPLYDVQILYPYIIAAAVTYIQVRDTEPLSEEK